MRNAYKLIQAGMKARHNLSQDRIESLDEIGFEWQFLSIDYDDKTFENRCLELILFKEEFGHCNVSCKGADNKSLGNWCSDMRKAYKKIQNGMKSRYKLSQYRIDRLEGIGFQWEVHVPFEKRWLELIAFKVDFGHCNVPNRYLDNKSLGNWCTGMRTAYKRTKISQDKIEWLEEIGFQWKIRGWKRKSSEEASDASTWPETQKKVKKTEKDSTQSNNILDARFDARCNQLLRYKEEFGHNNVPNRYPDNKSLGNWCRDIRKEYRKIQNGMKADRNLSAQYRIDRLEEIGFQWEVYVTFENRYRELIALKKEFEHCNVPARYPDNQSLAVWCTAMRGTKYRRNKLSQDKIEWLEEIDFQFGKSRAGRIRRGVRTLQCSCKTCEL